MRLIQSNEKKRFFALIRFYDRDAHYYSPHEWPFGTGYWKAYITCLMGVAEKSVREVRNFPGVLQQI